MTVRRNRISTIIPKLVIEDHPEDYTGLPFITLVQYNKLQLLTIVDNADDNHIKAYVLDLCGPEFVPIQTVIELAAYWFEHDREKYPLSVCFSKNDMAETTSKIFRSFNVEYVTRVIGPITKFNMKSTKSVRKRKRKPVV